MKKILMFYILLLCAVWSLPGVACTDGAADVIDCNNAGIDNGLDCYSYCYNGTEVNAVAICKPGFYPLDEIPKTSGYFKRCGTLQDACLNAPNGGVWNSYTKKCDCGGHSYEWSEKASDCVHSADYEACNTSGSNAYWDRINGNCICKESEQYWDESAHECREKPNKAECNEIKGKLTNPIPGNRTEVDWNPATQKCECIKDAAGKDIDNPDEYYVDNLWRCVKKRYILRREEVERNKPAADAKQRKIYAIIDDLKGLSDDMGKSHWKNASGGFNTARLASDSIAGVVLGTVGGVITSNVIKKNQVKGGFEDINCTVGGQRVAGFADEFNVGIQ